MSEIFGTSLSIKDNVSGVLKQAQVSAKGFRGEVDKAKKKLDEYDKKKIKEKELRIKKTKAFKAIEDVKKKLQPITKKVVEIKARHEHAMEKIKKVKDGLAKIKDNKVVSMTIKGAAGVTKALGKAALVGTAAAFTTVAVAGTAAVTNAAAFQAQMQNVGTLLDGDVAGALQKYGTQIKAVSNDTGIATSDLSDGLYQTVSAFGQSADNVKQLEIAAKAAKAGNATTTDSVNLLSAVTKAYGDTSAAAMQKASDLAFMTVKLGQTTYPEMAASMGGVIAMSSQLGVSQEALYGTMATLTGVTGNTAEVSTQLESVLSGFLSPTEDLSKALAKMGYSSGAAALEAEGLEGVVKGLQNQVGGSSLDLANLFSDKAAKQALLALTGDLADTWTDKTAQMSKASGATEAAFKTQEQSLSAMAGKVKNFGQNMLTSVGEQALPYLQTGLQALIDKMPEFEQAIGGIAARVGPGITKLGGYLSDLWTQWQPTLSELRTSFQSAFEQCQPHIQTMMSNFQAILPVVQPIVSSLGNVLASMLPVFTMVFSGISTVVADVFPAVAEIVQGIGSKISAIFGTIGSHAGVLQQIFAVMGPAISTVLSTAWSIVSPILDLVISAFGAVMDAAGVAFPYIQSAIETVWGVIQPILQGLADGLSAVSNGVSGAIEGVKKFFGATPATASSAVPAHANGTRYFGGGWTTVGEHGPELMNLPSGTQILSNQSSQNVGGGKKEVNIHIYKMEVRSDADIKAVADEIVKQIEETEENM